MSKANKSVFAMAAATVLLLASAQSALAQDSPKSAWRTAGQEIAASFREVGHAAAVTARKVSQKIHSAFSRHGEHARRDQREQQRA